MENKESEINELETVQDVQKQEEVPKRSPGRPPKKKEEAPVRTKRPKIDRNEEVLCRSITHGKLIYISKRTGIAVVWRKYGDPEFIEYGELMTMKASQPAFLERPLIIVEDDEVVTALGLNYIYEKLIDIENLDDFFNLSIKKMEEGIEKSPRGIKKLISNKARELIENGQLYDIRKIQMLERKLNVDLQIFLNNDNV